MHYFGSIFFTTLLSCAPATQAALQDTQDSSQSVPSIEVEQAWSKALHTVDLESVRRLAARYPDLVQRSDRRALPWVGLPLHFAVKRDMHDLVDLILELGGDVKSVNREGRAPIHMVRSASMVTRLLDAGADLHAVDLKGQNAMQTLKVWSKDERGDVVRRLMEAGMELDLATIVWMGWVDELRGLLEAKPPLVYDPAVLYSAARGGEEEALRMLLEAGWDANSPPPPAPNIINYWPPQSALEAAYWAEEMGAAAILLQAGAAPESMRSMEAWESIRGRMIRAGESGDLLDRAIGAGHFEACRLLLERGFDSDLGEVTAYGSQIHETRLVRAAWRGHLEIVRLLAESGADLDKTSHGASPLLAAAAAGHGEVYDLLVELGAKPSLHAAAALGRTEELRQLVGAVSGDLDVKEERCWRTPLAWAIQNEHSKAAELLIDVGATPELLIAKYPYQWVPYSLRDANTASLMPNVDFDEQAKGSSHLIMAIKSRLPKVVAKLREAGAIVNADVLVALCDCELAWASDLLKEVMLGPKEFENDLQWAIPAVKELLYPVGSNRSKVRSKVSDLEAEKRLGWLLDAGVRDQIVDGEGFSILAHSVSREVRPALALRLADIGVPVTFSIACSLGWIDQIRIMDSVSPRPIQERERALRTAIKKDNVEVFQLLIQGAPEGDRFNLMKSVSDATYGVSSEVFMYLSERGVIDWQRIFSNGESMLHRAACGDPDQVELLLKRGLAVDQQGYGGWTPLHRASLRLGRSKQTIELLLAAGADVDARDDNGNTPLLLLLRADHWRRANAARLLLEAGADPLAFGGNGLSAYEYALFEEDPEERAELMEIFARHLPAHFKGE